MSDPALRFTEVPYAGNTLGNLHARFRDQGYVVLPGVFERESVDAFREQVEAALVVRDDGPLRLPGESPLTIWPARAPRIRQVLAGALHPAAMKPAPSMFESAWLASKPGSPLRPDQGWHKDREHEGMPGAEYHYPRDVHVGIYFSDMTPELGPTQAIAGSHRDPARSPYRGVEPSSFLIRKEDAVLWDQRLWHRGTPRTVPGIRIFAIFGFYAVPVYGEGPHAMPASQRAAWAAATDPEEQVFFGGPFAPPE